MEIKRFGIDSRSRLVALNGPLRRCVRRKSSSKTFYLPAKVSVDVEFIAVNRNEALNFGLNR